MEQSNCPVTLYATDLDGTLLDNTANLSESASRAFAALQQRGALITFVTARTPATVEPILRSAHPQTPGVVMTGAAIWHPAERRYLSVIYHQPADVSQIIRICRSMGVTPFIYTLPLGDNKIIVYNEAQQLTPIEQRFVNDRTVNDLKSFCLARELPERACLEVVLFFAVGSPALIRATAEAIRTATSCYASWYPDTYNPGLALLEVFAPNVSKAKGLMRLKKLTGADRVIAFGDNLNDIPMLKSADLGIAVANAHPQVKEVADLTIPPNTEDSVIKYIRNDYLGIDI